MEVQIKPVDSLEIGPDTQAVMYKGIKYRIQDISTEGSLRRLKLVSLTFPRDITTVLWNPNSVVTTSALVTKRCLITKHIRGNFFEVEKAEGLTIELDFDKMGPQIYRWMIEGRITCSTLHFSFGEIFIEAAYILPKYGKLYLDMDSRIYEVV